jgi:hypothetical protein
MSTEELIFGIQENTEWLETTEGDTVECISIENLEALLTLLLRTTIKISQG